MLFRRRIQPRIDIEKNIRLERIERRKKINRKSNRILQSFKHVIESN